MHFPTFSNFWGSVRHICMHIVVKSKVTLVYLQNREYFCRKWVFVILKSSTMHRFVSIVSGYFSVTFRGANELLTPSELQDRSIWRSEVRVPKVELNMMVWGYTCVFFLYRKTTAAIATPKSAQNDLETS